MHIVLRLDNLMWAQGAAGACRYPLWWHFYGFFWGGPQLCSRTETPPPPPPPPLLFAEWLNSRPDHKWWLYWAPSLLAVGSLKWLFCWPWTTDVLEKSRPAMNMSIPCCSFSTYRVCSLPLRGFSKHSYIFPEDPCWLEYTQESMICGPWSQQTDYKLTF